MCLKYIEVGVVESPLFLNKCDTSFLMVEASRSPPGVSDKPQALSPEKCTPLQLTDPPTLKPAGGPQIKALSDLRVGVLARVTEDEAGVLGLRSGPQFLPLWNGEMGFSVVRYHQACQLLMPPQGAHTSDPQVGLPHGLPQLRCPFPWKFCPVRSGFHHPWLALCCVIRSADLGYELLATGGLGCESCPR